MAFDSDSCPACGADLGYVDVERVLRVLGPTDEASTYLIGPDRHLVWRCLNAAWGCNWVLPARQGDIWCRSCRLTRGRPDQQRQRAMEAWMTAESAKRRLVHQLDGMGLPIESRSNSTPDGVAFDLVHLPGEGGLTGHLDGVVTLDLAETDERHREDLRRYLGEPFRTVIGHLRHEIGHYYWQRLVGRTEELSTFRQLFDDERREYGGAIDQHYAGAGGADRRQFVTDYAAAHPLEDWAETFAHHLHIVDALDTAAAHGLLGPTTEAVSVDAVLSVQFGDVLRAWRPMNRAVNAIAESLGQPVVYPFEPVGLVVDKLTFVHERIGAHVGAADTQANG